jgi:competence protein ComEA
MLKKILVLLAMLYAAASFAAVDVNKATATELDALKGIGPVMSKRIIDERKKGDFKSWADFIARVKGIGEGSASKLSSEGLTVKGEEFKASKAEKKAVADEKKELKAEKKEEKKEAKAEKKEEKTAAKESKKEEKKEEKAAAAAKPAASAKK